jgi:hypothetical protein
LRCTAADSTQAERITMSRAIDRDMNRLIEGEDIINAEN